MNAVDRLPFYDAELGSGTLVLWQYLKEGLGLEFGQERHCEFLERIRVSRNKMVHEGASGILFSETVEKARVHLGGFAVAVVVAGAASYPDACGTEREDEGEGVPGYVYAEEYC